MRTAAIVTALSAAGVATAQSQNAPLIPNQPVDISYSAKLPEKPFFPVAGLEGNVKGYISASAGPSGQGVQFTVKFENLPKEGGPFPYHIHVKPSDGNCTATGAHLDPYERGEDPPCDASKPETCQVGDLSGKHGKITSDPFEVQYTDPYLTLVEGEPAFFGNRSFVVHFANKTRITCANFDFQSGYPMPTNTTTPPVATGTGAPTTVPTSTGVVPFPGAGSALDAPIRLVAAGVALMMFVF